MPSQSMAQSETHTKGQTYENHSEHIGSEEIIIDPGTGWWSHRNPVFTDSTAWLPLRDQPDTVTLSCAAWHSTKHPQTNPYQS